MKKFILLFSLFSISFSSYGKNRLEVYCEDDPTGELYSSSWDAHPHDFLEEIGLPEQKYRDLIDSIDSDMYNIGSFKDFVDLLKNDYPELEYKFIIWKLKTCLSNGYGYLHGSL